MQQLKNEKTSKGKWLKLKTFNLKKCFFLRNKLLACPALAGKKCPSSSIIPVVNHIFGSINLLLHFTWMTLRCMLPIQQLNLLWKLSREIKMELGLYKSAKIHLKRGRVVGIVEDPKIVDDRALRHFNEGETKQSLPESRLGLTSTFHNEENISHFWCSLRIFWSWESMQLSHFPTFSPPIIPLFLNIYSMTN